MGRAEGQDAKYPHQIPAQIVSQLRTLSVRRKAWLPT